MKQLYSHAQSKISSLWMQGVDVILPPRCPVSGDLVDEHGMISAQIWAGLSFISEPYCTCCGIPLDFESETDMHCMACIDYPPVFHTARAAIRYEGVGRDLVLGFKHGDKTHLAQSFIPWIEQVGKEVLDRADYLIPVPLHPWRLVSRRYNQATLMAEVLSKSSNVPYLPLALKRIRSTPSQGHLTFAERKKNVRSAFGLNPKYQSVIEGKALVLIDDVYTTGATVNECAKLLYKNGAKRVDVLTLARVMLKSL